MFRLRVKEVLDEKGVSQGALSRGADIPMSTVQKLVHSKTYIPSVLTLDKAAKFLGVPVETLYYDDEKEEPPAAT